MKYPIFFFSGLLLLLLIASCASTEPVPQGKLPPRTSSAPDYVSDKKLKEEITQLSSDLIVDPSNTEKLLRLGSIYVELEDADAAIKTLEQLKALDFREEPKVYATLGELYDAQDNYSEALENYRLFKGLLHANSSLHNKVDEKISLLEFKIKTIEAPYNIELIKLPADINTTDSEYLSQFTIDDEQVVFTRRYNGQEDLFLAMRQEGGSYHVKSIDAVNTPFNEGAHTISADGSILIFTHCNEKFGFGGCDLYQSKRQSDGEWSQPSNLGEQINTRHWESQPSLSADGSTLFFASNNPNGKGGSDLWVTIKKEDGAWNIPKNLGGEINTGSREESPFIHPDGKTLYFRSKGHQGLGDYDIFKANSENGKWGGVTNLGSPINSSGNDGALVVSLDGLIGYYATDYYKGEKMDHLDIVKFELPEQFRPEPMTYFKGRVIDRNSNLPLHAEVRIESTDGISKTYQTDYNGQFLIAIPVGTPTQIHITSEGHIFYSDYITYDEVRHGVDPHVSEIALEVPELAMEEETTEPIVLRNIFFETGSAQLLTASESEIEYLYDLLDKYPTIRIRIVGHTDNVGNEDRNLKLSQDRAESVRSALVQRGINASRMESRGMGETQPIDTNDRPQGRSNNRRTEFSIVK